MEKSLKRRTDNDGTLCKVYMDITVYMDVCCVPELERVMRLQPVSAVYRYCTYCTRRALLFSVEATNLSSTSGIQRSRKVVRCTAACHHIKGTRPRAPIDSIIYRGRHGKGIAYS